MEIGINKIVSVSSGTEAGPVAPPQPIVKKGGTDVRLSNAKTGPGEEPTPDKIEKAAADVQRRLDLTSTSLRLEVDSRSHQVIVKIIDSQTNEVIMQIPSEELLAIKDRLSELVGVLYDSKS
ncbi:MAG: flagellar protein FlaG [Deltaproteobacteria bacterium]|nr:flagellar protein FlaG [Deltaproteobacteria bacterium]